MNDVACFNKIAYEASDVVKTYTLLDNLKKPEAIVLSNLKSKLRNMKMLDIGVGGGRTTLHFAHLTKEYIGIDYSVNMIAACKKRFPELAKKNSFRACDVRFMNIFEDNYFDFILFSFNGIDYLSYEDRLKALQEIKRVGRKGGIFFFSTHNLQGVDILFKIWDTNPIEMLSKMKRYLFLIPLRINIKHLKSKKCVIINDGEYNSRLLTYYVKPEEQISQLTEIGFKNIKIYSWESGEEIEDLNNLDTIKDPYLHCLCIM